MEACEKILRPTLPGWHFYWNNSTVKKGYSGVAILSRSCPNTSFFSRLQKVSLVPQSWLS